MRLLFVVCIFLTVCTRFVRLSEYDNKESTALAKDSDDRPLIFTTLGGGMVAVDQRRGNIIWKLKDEPVVKVPSSDGNPISQFLPDPRHGFLYAYGARPGEKHTLKKMPYTIPELVANAPCRSTDGILYTGKKSDTWFMIDPKTGFRERVSGFDKTPFLNNDDEANTCSLDKKKAIYFARTEYNILMHDFKSENQKWNVTFYDYRSHPMAPDMVNEYDTVHFTSTSSGRIMSFDRKTGELLWSHDLESPIVSVYLLGQEGLTSVPFHSVGDDTMDHIREDVTTLRHGKGLKNSNMELFPTLYIGEHNHGLYALSSLVDKDTMTISTPHSSTLLLEGPLNEANGQNDIHIQSDEKDHENVESSQNGANGHYRIEDMIVEDYIPGPFLLLGHYKVPEMTNSWIPKLLETGLVTASNMLRPNYDQNVMKFINGDNPKESYDDEDNRTKLLTRNKETDSKGVQTETEETEGEETPYRFDLIHKHVYIWINQQENKALKVALIILMGLVITMFWYLQYQAREFQQLSQGGSRGSNSSSSSKYGNVTAYLEEIGDGEVKIGKISFWTDQVLGKGCEGTFVYRGSFDSRAVAVKRLLPECFTFADREVALLRESDAHPHVVRYYCTEQDKQFRYIALELCAATLQDYVEKKIDFEHHISPIDILRQATEGLAHLHSLDIVHRDVKPHNVLLSVTNARGEVRAMISDFGLCKKLNIGRTSFSRRSGVTGTDGWIAPEMINGERTTTLVDIFSLGCVFHYVLSKGKHPFGDVLRRQANILTNDYNLEPLNSTVDEENLVVTKILIRAMISARPNKRPPCCSTLKYPIFWSKKTQLNFLQDVSDHVEIATCGASECVEGARGVGACGVVRGDWRAHVCSAVAADLRRRRTYDGRSVADLLRAIRNKKHHYRELDTDVRDSLGRIPDGFVTYWLKRFPLLLPHVWIQMQCYSTEDLLSLYYLDNNYTFDREDIPELLVADNGEDELHPDLCDPEKNQLFVKSRFYQDPADKDNGDVKNKYYKPNDNRFSPRRRINGYLKPEKNIDKSDWRSQDSNYDDIKSIPFKKKERKKPQEIPVWVLPQQ